MLYPNPTTGIVTISLGNTVKQANIEIYNLHGTSLSSKKFRHTTTATIDLTGFSKGMYFVKAIVDGINYQEKIIKE